MRRLILSLVLCVAIIAPLSAQPVCDADHEPQAIYDRGVSNGWTIEYLTPAQVAAFMVAYNAEPPVGDDQADVVMVGIAAGAPMARVQIFHQGCWVGGYEAPPSIIRQMATPVGTPL